VSRIGDCDCCDRTSVPLGFVEAFGIETYACYICKGYDDPDPYGEAEAVPPADRQVTKDIEASQS
jgi:hypothetical protein